MSLDYKHSCKYVQPKQYVQMSTVTNMTILRYLIEANIRRRNLYCFSPSLNDKDGDDGDNNNNNNNNNKQ
jgi:hypothetical protein